MILKKKILESTLIKKIGWINKDSRKERQINIYLVERNTKVRQNFLLWSHTKNGWTTQSFYLYQKDTYLNVSV